MEEHERPNEERRSLFMAGEERESSSHGRRALKPSTLPANQRGPALGVEGPAQSVTPQDTRHPAPGTRDDRTWLDVTAKSPASRRPVMRDRCSGILGVCLDDEDRPRRAEAGGDGSGQ